MAMRSLYNHEGLSHSYTELSPQSLTQAAGELREIEATSCVPRQIERARVLLSRLAFEEIMRDMESRDGISQQA